MTSAECQWIWLAVVLLVSAGVILLDVFLIRMLGTEGSFSYAIGMAFQNYPVPMAIVLILFGMFWGHTLFPVMSR